MVSAKNPDNQAEKGIRQEAHLLMDSLQGSVSELSGKIEAEKDEGERSKMKLKLASLEKALSARKSPVSSSEKLKNAIDQTKYDQFLLERLSDGSFDQVDLNFLMQSDLFPFFDDDSQGQLQAAFEQMHTNDEAKTLLSRPGLIHMEESIGTSAPRKMVGLPELLSVVNDDVLHKIRMTLKEAQFIRMERIKEYLSSQLNGLNEQIDEAKQSDIFSEEMISKLYAEIGEAKKLLIDENGDPSLLGKVDDNILKASHLLKNSHKEMEALRSNRPDVEAQIHRDYDTLKASLSAFTPDKIEQSLEAYRQKLLRNKIPEDGANMKKAERALNELIDGNSELHQHMAEFELRLQTLGQMSPEELIQIKADLEVLKPKLEILGGMEERIAEDADAKKAHQTIQALEGAGSADEIKASLESNLGTQHLEFVPHDLFEGEYRQYTEKGHMVFYERGDEWKIILDESALQGTESVAELKKQLTHELLHLEFEKGKDIKDQIRKELVEGNPEQWQNIRAAFIKMADSTGKQPPHGEKWEDDDILSELYAMQNEMGQIWSKGDSPTDKLNNLLVGAGAGKVLGNMSEKIQGYEDDSIEKIRGYESGVEAGEQFKEPTASTTQVETQSKSEATYLKNKENIDHIKSRIKELKKSEYLELVPDASALLSAMSDYTEGTESLNDDVRRNADSDILIEEIGRRNKKVSGDLNEIEDLVGKAARKAPNNEIGLFRKLWLNTSFMSMEDFVQLGIDAYEFFQRRHKRKNADHAAQLGMALFSGSDLGREAKARQQKAEAEEVNEWKSRYENLDAWELYDELHSLAQTLLPNADQLKAILRILSDKGRLDWRNEDLWIALNKLQAAVVLKPGDQILLHNPILLRQRLHRAMGEIYDYDEFTSLERGNESAYESEKGKFDAVHDRTQDKLTDRLDQLLARAREDEQIDPILYESIIEYCIKNGKSYAENVMFHLIVGMAEGLLAPDRGLALGKHLNLWPPIDWFSSRQPPYSTADWKWLCESNFKESFEKGSITVDGGADFKNWFWTEVQNTPAVVDRVKKSVGERGWDHDWGRSIACLGDADTAKRFLAGRSGQQETKATAVGNAYVGAVQWLEENAKNPQFASKENFARMAGWVAMAEGVLDGTAYNRKESDISTRQNESMNSAKPREGGVGNHGDLTTKQHRDITLDFLYMIDGDFFGILSGQECRDEEKKKELGLQAAGYLAQRYPSLAAEMADIQTIDQIYDRLDMIISTMFGQMSEQQFQLILATLAANAQAKS